MYCMYVCIGEENNFLVAKNEALQHSQEELEKSVSEITKFKEVFVLMYVCMYVCFIYQVLAFVYS